MKLIMKGRSITSIEKTFVKYKKPTFNWSDPLLLHDQLLEEEILVRSTALEYCNSNLQNRIVLGNRHEVCMKY